VTGPCQLATRQLATGATSGASRMSDDSPAALADAYLSLKAAGRL